MKQQASMLTPRIAKGDDGNAKGCFCQITSNQCNQNATPTSAKILGKEHESHEQTSGSLPTANQTLNDDRRLA